MAKNANPVIHELAVQLALRDKSTLSEKDIKKFYGDYLIAVKTLSELDNDEEFKAKTLSPPKRRLRSSV